MKHGEKIFYSSENDEVVSFKNKSLQIDENYKYISKNPLYRFFSWFTYRFIATPYAFIVFKLIKKVKFHNSKILKEFKHKGYFIYANHTNQFSDGFCPGLICFPQKPHLIVNSANLSIPIVGKFTKMWGAIPLPNTFEAIKNFHYAMEKIIEKNPIVIYPEAHLWPYYTKIRDFPTTSFRYPVKYNKPVFTFTTIYKKKKLGKKPKIEIYVDGPFYSNDKLPEKEQQKELKNIVFNQLKERANLNNYEYIKYIHKEKK